MDNPTDEQQRILEEESDLKELVGRLIDKSKHIGSTIMNLNSVKEQLANAISDKRRKKETNFLDLQDKLADLRGNCDKQLGILALHRRRIRSEIQFLHSVKVTRTAHIYDHIFDHLINFLNVLDIKIAELTAAYMDQRDCGPEDAEKFMALFFREKRIYVEIKRLFQEFSSDVEHLLRQAKQIYSRASQPRTVALPVGILALGSILASIDLISYTLDLHQSTKDIPIETYKDFIFGIHPMFKLGAGVFLALLVRYRHSLEEFLRDVKIVARNM